MDWLIDIHASGNINYTNIFIRIVVVLLGLRFENSTDFEWSGSNSVFSVSSAIFIL